MAASTVDKVENAFFELYDPKNLHFDTKICFLGVLIMAFCYKYMKFQKIIKLGIEMNLFSKNLFWGQQVFDKLVFKSKDFVFIYHR